MCSSQYWPFWNRTRHLAGSLETSGPRKGATTASRLDHIQPHAHLPQQTFLCDVSARQNIKEVIRGFYGIENGNGSGRVSADTVQGTKP